MIYEFCSEIFWSIVEKMPKRNEVTGEWSKLYNAELTKYCSGDQIEKNEMAGACSTYGEGGDIYRVLVGKPEGKRRLERPRRRWEDNMKMNLQQVRCGAWTGLIWLRKGAGWRLLVNAVMNLWVP
jgi:hypothetical protein